MSEFETIHFTAGFTFRGIRFGFYVGSLYRMPYKSGTRQYPVKLLPVITVGNTTGYRCARQKLSDNKIHSLLRPVNWKITLMIKQM